MVQLSGARALPCASTLKDNSVVSFNQSVFIKASKPCEQQKDLILHGFQYTPPSPFQIMFLADDVKLEVFPESDEGIMLGEPFYLKPVQISDIFNTNSTGIGYMYYQQNDYHDTPLVVIGPHTISFDQFMASIKYSIMGPLLTSNITLNISFFFLKQSSYHVGSNTVSIRIIQCQLGYTYSDATKTCVCVNSDKVKCPSDSRRLCVKYHYWYSNYSKSAYPCPTMYCRYDNERCPMKSQDCFGSTDYCSIAKSSDVCWEGRGGVLCSECQGGFSFTIGAFRCVNTATTCTSKNTVLVIVLLLIYWTAFTAVLLVVLSLQLRIGSGFMYGIIYYFSVVTLYTGENSLFSDSWMRYILHICVALTQLDCYVLFAMIMPYCFARTWTTPLPHVIFQYAGPVFVITLITAAIFLSSYCRLPKRLRLSRSSPIHAICMLVLISYTSLSNTSFQLLLPTFVESNLKVKIAPSVGYFSGTHIPYAFVAIIVEVIISIPICILLLFAPCISRRINMVKYKLKPIVDEFQACYRPECRWFAGFYFLARQLVYFTNGLFSETTPQANTLLVLLNIIIWTIHTSFQPYQKMWLNILDTILLTDLVLLSSSSVVQQNIDLEHNVNKFIHQTALPYVLILVPTCYLIGTLVVIFGQKLSCKEYCFSKLWATFYLKQKISNRNTVNSGDVQEDQAKHEDPYYRDDDVREPLLEESSSVENPRRRKSHLDYGGVSSISVTHPQQYSPDITSTSFRVTGLKYFPPDLDKSTATN